MASTLQYRFAWGTCYPDNQRASAGTWHRHQRFKPYRWHFSHPLWIHLDLVPADVEKSLQGISLKELANPGSSSDVWLNITRAMANMGRINPVEARYDFAPS